MADTADEPNSKPHLARFAEALASILEVETGVIELRFDKGTWSRCTGITGSRRRSWSGGTSRPGGSSSGGRSWMPSSQRLLQLSSRFGIVGGCGGFLGFSETLRSL